MLLGSLQRRMVPTPPPPTPITSFTLFVVPGPGRTAAQIWPGQLLLGALLFLAYEPQLQLAILSWPIEAKFLWGWNHGFKSIGSFQFLGLYLISWETVYVKPHSGCASILPWKLALRGVCLVWDSVFQDEVNKLGREKHKKMIEVIVLWGNIFQKRRLFSLNNRRLLGKTKEIWRHNGGCIG